MFARNLLVEISKFITLFKPVKAEKIPLKMQFHYALIVMLTPDTN